MKNLKARIVGTGVKSKDYLTQTPKRGDSDYRMSRSDLIEFARCPHRWVSGYRDEGSDATDWGSMLDAMALGDFASVYEVLPASYISEDGKLKPWNANANVCKKIIEGAESFGLIPVKAKDADRVREALGVLLAEPEIHDMLLEPRSQVLMHGEWIDRETGIEVPLRALIDIVPDASSKHFNALADLKTCDDASPADWGRKVYKWGYHIQAALYLDLYESATGEGRTDLLHIVQESKPPYEVGRRYLSQEFIELGRDFYQTALKRYAKCLLEKRWPGYDEESRNGWTPVEPEAWMVSHMAAQMTA